MNQLDPFERADERDLQPTEPIAPDDEPTPAVERGAARGDLRRTVRTMPLRPAPEPKPSTDAYLNALALIAREDVEGLLKAQQSYGDSWKRRGGVGAFMMLARKWDRLENAMTVPLVRPNSDPDLQPVDRYDIFTRTLADGRAEGLIDDIRDLRRYLMLVEAELRARGLNLKHRDNG